MVTRKPSERRKNELPSGIDQWTNSECLYYITALRDLSWLPSAIVMSHLSTHKNIDVRRAAIDGLGRVGGSRARRELLDLLPKLRGKEIDELVVNSLNYVGVCRMIDLDILLTVIEDQRYTDLAKANAIYGIRARLEFSPDAKRLFPKISGRLLHLANTPCTRLKATIAEFNRYSEFFEGKRSAID